MKVRIEFDPDLDMFKLVEHKSGNETGIVGTSEDEAEIAAYANDYEVVKNK